MIQQRPYQVEGSAFLLEQGRAVLADDPGTGKTNMGLMAARGRTLILSPAALSDVWGQELGIWDNPEAEFHWMSYSGICKRVPAEPGKPASMVVALPRAELPKQWDTIIADESHYLKNRKTNWTKVVADKLKTERLYLLTGTPLPNWGHEIYMFLKLLHPGDRRFTNYWNWINEWFRTWKPPWGGTEIKGLQRGVTWEEAAREWDLTGRWLRRTIDDVLPDLPPMTEQTIKVKMTAKQEAAYKSMKKAYFATLPATGEQLVVWDDGAKHTKLVQLSTGLETLNLEETGSAKLDALDLLMRDRDRPTLVFCAFKNTAEAATRRIEKLGHSVTTISSNYGLESRKKSIEAFRQGKVDVLVGTVGTMSEGYTLTRADTCIFVERSPRPVTNLQAKRRIRRFGQEHPTLAINLVTEDSVDEGLSELLEKKGEEQDLALTGIQLAQMA